MSRIPSAPHNPTLSGHTPYANKGAIDQGKKLELLQGEAHKIRVNVRCGQRARRPLDNVVANQRPLWVAEDGLLIEPTAASPHQAKPHSTAHHRDPEEDPG